MSFSLLKNDLTVIPVATLLAYGSSYFYQLGVADYYGYPSILIINDLNSFFNGILGLGIFLSLGALIMSLLAWVNNKNLGFWPGLTIVIISFAITYLYFIGFNKPSDVFHNGRSISILTCMTIIFFPINYYNLLSSMIYRNKTKDIKNHMKNNAGPYIKKPFFSYLSKLELSFLLVAFAGMIASISYSSGKLINYLSVELYILKDSNDAILLNSFSDRIIIGECSNNKPNYLIKKSDGNLTLNKVTDKTELRKIKSCFEASSING
ncbi:hypothetical protein V5037_02250 [Enterobacter ludwigii]|uniref:hypothetical protein n=1 Tax=Enterobacter ludwigii TaxID=299767 RepID=UPI0030764BCF